MGLTYLNLSLIRYIQEKQVIALVDVASKFHKNTTTIRREIEIINLYVEQPIIEIKKGICMTKLSYHDYACFVQSISLMDYSSNLQERLDACIVSIYFQSYINASKLYEHWGLSLTTKKQDMIALRAYLETYGLALVSLHRKGLCIQGDELRFRFLVIQILYPLFDMNEYETLTPRITNTPFESSNIKYLTTFQPHYEQAFRIIKEFLQNYEVSLTNASEKFFLLFICMIKTKPMTSYTYDKLNLPLVPLNLYVSEDAHENYIYNIVLSLFDYSLNLDLPFDDKLWNHTTLFVTKIEECLTSKLYTLEELIQESYSYFYKQIMLSYFHVKLEDRLVRNTKEHLPILYEIIQKYTYIFEQTYQLNFYDDQLSTLTLLFQKAIIRNRIINKQGGNNKKRIVIVSNSSYERMQYFVLQLKEYVEVSFVKMITLNELYLLDNVAYDYVFALSERIFNILKNQNLPVIKLHYFLENQDIDRLLLYGFARIQTKFLTKDFVNDIQDMDKEEMIVYLKTKYSEYFI